MAVIEKVDTFLVDVPTIRAHVLSMATMRSQTMCFVRLRCSDGIEGLGEATTISGLSYGEESPEGIKLAIDNYIGPVIEGQDLAFPAKVMARLEASIVGNHFAKCAIETALFDAVGKRCGLPASELLGGRQRDQLPVLWTLASGDTTRDIDEAQEMLDRRRHNAFKIKIGRRSIAEDVEHVAQIKKALSDRISLRVDVNQAWDEISARLAIDMLTDAGIDLVEQPIARQNRAGMARLAATSRIPIMADEALRGPSDAYDLAARGAANVFAVKIAQSGGLSNAKRVAAVAEAAGIALYGGTMLEAGIGTIASAHLFATFSSLPFGTELFGPLLLTEQLLSEPLTYHEFTLDVPRGPGLGVAFNEDAIAFFRRDRVERRTLSFPAATG